MIILLLIAVSLSMDAFSLSLAYGTLHLEKKYILRLSLIVGIYHFFMPLLGTFIGNFILNVINIKPEIIVFIILVFIGLQMIIDSFKHDNKIKILSNIELLLFGLAVSIDSFSVGIGLNSINNNCILSSIVFSISAFIFTYLGLILGKKISEIIGTLANILGGLVLIIIGTIYLI